MSKKAVVFSDVDGTLYARDTYVSNFNLDIIKSSNLSFNIATGNPICPRMIKLAKLVNADYIIGSSGAQIFDYKHNKFIKEDLIEKETVKKIFKLFKENNIPAAAWSSKVFYIFREEEKEFLNKIYFRYETFDQFTLYKGEEDIEDVAKIEVYFEHIQNIDSLIEDLKKLNCKLIKTHMNLEILPIGESKGKAIVWMLENVLTNYNKDEIMVIGDSENDFSMFKRFNYSYVMDNAKDEVKKEANFITKAVQEHGLGYAIQDYLEKFEKMQK
ncbi:haloacid dehalogenase-like hydrolase [Mycoplasmopsis maculosa]|uniref:Haloacid dehalogenase-like hydrolase n=1 Tax=Mycoplasmopsis maculosa TaxID=114885 RepID=A0A449B3X3_9BACT|nr:Cof-type HAD-IIB family hydrolase [Mycoplasmopsis maculosa]VEU75238.1 haloacid dehalogenase-like hydrolase [Mycoplasmopsis maculosa]